MQRSAQLPLSHWALVRLLTQTAVEHTRKAWNAIAPQSEHWVRRVGSSMSICCRWGCAGCLSGFQLGGVGAPAVARHGLSVASTIYLRVQGVGVCAAAHKVMATGEADTARPTEGALWHIAQHRCFGWARRLSQILCSH